MPTTNRGSSEHYVNPESVIAISVVFPVLSIIAVGGRIYARRLKNIGLGPDDWFSIAGTVLLIGCSIDLLVGVSTNTVGRHTVPSGMDFNIPGIQTLDKVEWSYNMMWYVGISMVKLSFLFFYRRLFRGTLFNMINWIMVYLVASWGICFFFITLFQCGSNFHLNWTPLPQFLDPKCINSLDVFFANSLVSCFFDCFILIIPLPLVWQLNMTTRLKFNLTALFALGAFCIGASALRLTNYSELWWAVRTHNLSASILGLKGADDFGIVSLALFWSQIELGVGNITCCLLSFRPLLDSQIFRSLTSLRSIISLGSLRGNNSKLSGEGSREDSIVDKNTRDVPEILYRTREESNKERDIDLGHYMTWEDRPLEDSSVQMYCTDISADPKVHPKVFEEGRIERRIDIEQTRQQRVKEEKVGKGEGSLAE